MEWKTKDRVRDLQFLENQVSALEPLRSHIGAKSALGILTGITEPKDSPHCDSSQERMTLLFFGASLSVTYVLILGLKPSYHGAEIANYYF